MPDTKPSRDSEERSICASIHTKPVDKDHAKARKDTHTIRIDPPSDERTDLIMRLIVRLKTS
jgi:hypothetical protein